MSAPWDGEELESDTADELAGEPHDIVEPDEPDWFDCPVLPRRDMLAVVAQHKELDGRSVNLFRNALERQPRSGLLDHYIGPNLYQPGSHYIYTTPDTNRYRYKN
jgi:hypothetical protein